MTIGINDDDVAVVVGGSWEVLPLENQRLKLPASFSLLLTLFGNNNHNNAKHHNNHNTNHHDTNNTNNTTTTATAELHDDGDPSVVSGLSHVRDCSLDVDPLVLSSSRLTKRKQQQVSFKNVQPEQTYRTNRLKL